MSGAWFTLVIIFALAAAGYAAIPLLRAARPWFGRWLAERAGVKALEQAIIQDQQTARSERMALDVRVLALEVEVAKLQAAQPGQIVRESPQAKKEVIRAKNFREFRQSVETEEEATNGV